jgi:micrococcal nuclease
VLDRPTALVAMLAVPAVLALVGCERTGSATGTTTGTTTPTALAPNATVERVVDGDTVDVRIDDAVERVRLIGIDTPETKRHDVPVECYGPEATAFTEQLLAPGTPVLLVRDVVGRDDFGRILAYVYRTRDGVFVNLELARGGYAQPLTIPPNTAHRDELVDAARDAERAERGLWASCEGG